MADSLNANSVAPNLKIFVNDKGICYICQMSASFTVITIKNKRHVRQLWIRAKKFPFWVPIYSMEKYAL